MRFSLALLVLLAAALAAGPASAQPLAPPGGEAFAAAYALYDAGLYGEAARAFEAFRADYPDHPQAPEALFYGGQSELAMGRGERAAALLSAFRLRYPTHPLAPRARLAVGEYHFARGDDDRAIAALNEALREDQPMEDAARARLLIGQAHLRQQRFDDAATELQRAARLYPRAEAAPAALYTLGVAEAERGNWEGAADAFERLEVRYRRSPQDRMVGLKLAEAYQRTGRYDRVVAEVDRRLAEIPDAEVEGGLPVSPSVQAERRTRRDRAQVLAGDALLRLNRASEAEQRFRAVSQEPPYARHAAFGLARVAYGREDWTEAAALFATAYPESGTLDAMAAEALYLEGLALRRAGRLDQATDRLAAVARRAPDSAVADAALYEQGLLLYTTRRWDEAVPVFSGLLDRYPNSTFAGESARMLGETYASLGDFARAEQAARRARELGVATAELGSEVAFQQGYQALQEGRLDEAERVLAQLASNDPTGERAGEALFWAGEAAFQAGQAGQRGAYDRALDRLNTFLTRYPDHRQRDAARYVLAWTYFKQGNYGRAAEAFERFLASYRPSDELVPYTIDARLRLGDSYFATRRWDQAIAAYRRIDGAAQDYARFQIGQAYAFSDRFDQARSSFSSLLTDFPDSPLRPQARFAIGDLYFQRGEYATAIATFEEVIARHRSSPIAAKAQYTIGEALYNQQQFERALEAYRAVLERYPSSLLVPDAVSAIEVTLAALGREDEIRRIVDRYAQQNPGSGGIDEARFRQAESRFQRGDLDGSIADFNALLGATRDPELRAPVLLYIGRANLQLGRHAQAEQAFGRLIAEHPSSPLRPEAERRLATRYVDVGRFDEALPLFRRAQRDADDETEAAEARLGEALALVGLRRFGEAEPILRAAATDAPNATLAARARLRLADVLDQTGRSAEAARAYEELARDESGDMGAEAASRLVASLWTRGDAQGLLSATDRLDVERRFAGFPERTAEVLLHRARAFRRLGQDGRAQEVYDRVLSAYPDTPAAAVAGRERDV